jgi:toxin ParE1/3/4
MTREFRLTAPAIADMKEIADYLATQASFNQADQFLRKADQKFSKIAQFPNLGKVRPEILTGLRSIPLDNYLILYTVSDDSVEILRVVSGYRNLAALFEDSEG